MRKKIFYLITKVLCIMTLTVALSFPYTTGFAVDFNIEGAGFAVDFNIEGPAADSHDSGKEFGFTKGKKKGFTKGKGNPHSSGHTPIPTTIILLGSGLVVLVALRRKFRKS